MRSFYHERKARGLVVPYILGLSASPVMRSNPDSVEQLEETLDAICRTPTKHRADLLLQVKSPTLSEVFYQSSNKENDMSKYTKTIASLGRVYGNLKITDDPYVISLQAQNTERSQRELAKVLLKHNTTSMSQMKAFYAMSLKICQELGAWAADYYISEVIARFLSIAHEIQDSLGGIWDLLSEEKRYMAKALQQVEISRTESELPQAIPLISDKARKLIDTLLQESVTCRGIVFVQERVMVYILAHLLSVHPDTRGRFKIGTMVGMSSHANRPGELKDLIGVESRDDSLVDFRAGRVNLLIATSVLEEGIDVPSCNVVLCFQKPANLKSFIQRRGRARAQDSKLILLLEASESKSAQWQQLEADMKALYENDMRMLQELQVLEDTEEHDGRFLRVEKTGAVLDFDNAVSVS